VQLEAGGAGKAMAPAPDRILMTTDTVGGVWTYAWNWRAD